METNQTNEIEVTCPFCGNTGSVKVPIAVYTKKKWGTVKIHIPAGAICRDHHFIALIDTEGVVRGFEKIESFKSSKEHEQRKLTLNLTLNDLISFFTIEGFIHLLHAMLFNYKVYVVKNDLTRKNAIDICAFFSYILPQKYRSEERLVLIEKTDLNILSKKCKDALLINANNKIVYCPWIESVDFIRAMVKKSLEIIRQVEQIIILQQELSKFANLAEIAKDIL
ncbi:MAG: hypothetical protein ACFE8P_01950, partial [Promethearchaeota archaeon]